MSAKPTVFTWATSTSFAGGPLPGKPTKVYPSSGKAAEGFHPAELPPAQNLNALLGRIGLWTQYLSDGDLTGNHTITGTFGVTGNTTLTGTLEVSAATTLLSDLEVQGSIINTPVLPQGAAFTGGPFAITGVLSPAALALGDNDDFNHASLADSNVLRLEGDGGGSNLTGLVGGAAGRIVTIFNVGSPDITVVHEDAGSTEVNRILLPNATASVAIRDNGSMTLWYDNTTARWRVLSAYL